MGLELTLQVFVGDYPDIRSVELDNLDTHSQLFLIEQDALSLKMKYTSSH